MYKYIDDETPYEVVSKMLVYNRYIEMDKVAEIIGKKDDKTRVSIAILRFYRKYVMHTQEGLITKMEIWNKV